MTLLLGALLVAVAVGLLSMAMREAPDQRGVARSIALIEATSAAPEALAWELVESDIMRSLSGEYRFVELAGGTQVTYELEVELVLPLPR